MVTVYWCKQVVTVYWCKQVVTVYWCKQVVTVCILVQSKETSRYSCGTVVFDGTVLQLESICNYPAVYSRFVFA